MMLQLLAHLVGDYIFQTDKQAKEKRKSAFQCAIHAFTYALAFLILRPSSQAFAVIALTHWLIDHYDLARYVVRLKNSLGNWSERAQYDTATGYPLDTPFAMSFWLLIITDNTMHLLINYWALRYL